MSKYSSKPVVINRPAAEIFNRFEDLSAMQAHVDSLPPEQMAQLGNVTFDKDSITLANPQIGNLKFVVKSRVAPTSVVFATEASPIPLDLYLDLKPLSDSSTEATTTIDVELPMMLKPLLGGKLQEAADRMAQMLANLNSR